MLRKVEDKDLVGKTIKSISCDCVNVLKLSFEDGSEIELWAEDAIFTSYGNLAGIFIDEKKNETS